MLSSITKIHYPIRPAGATKSVRPAFVYPRTFVPTGFREQSLGDPVLAPDVWLTDEYDFLGQSSLPGIVRPDPVTYLEFPHGRIKYADHAPNRGLTNEALVGSPLPAAGPPEPRTPQQFYQPWTEKSKVALGAPIRPCGLQPSPTVEAAPADMPPQQQASHVPTASTRQEASAAPATAPSDHRVSKRAAQSSKSTPPVLGFATVRDAKEFLEEHVGRGRPSKERLARVAIAKAVINSAQQSSPV